MPISHTLSWIIFSLILAMATSITIFLVFLLLTKCCCKRRVDPNPNIEDPFSGGPRGVDQTVIDSLMTFTYTLAQGKKLCRGMNVCVICLAVFREHETLRSMPRCGHVFHSGCVDSWLRTHSTCPCCRAIVLPKPGRLFSRFCWPAS